MIDLPEGYTLSDDGLTLSWELHGGGLVRRGSIEWDPDRPPDDELLQIAVDGAPDASGVLHGAGEGLSMRRIVLFGRLFFLCHMTGPPTWWCPRFIPSIKKRELVVGWLQQGFAVTYEGRQGERRVH